VTPDNTPSPELIYNPINVNARGYFLQEDINIYNHFKGQQKLSSRYLQFDLPLTNKFKFIGGARQEDNYQSVKTPNPQNQLGPSYDGRYEIKEYIDDEKLLVLGSTYSKIQSVHANKNLLPSANFSYDFTENQNLKVSYFESVIRPDFREFSPFAFQNQFNAIVEKGNPSLDRS
jgi:outer membrane receptor protein involved in Fe transport